jgi:hypothetical protein
LSDQTLKSRGQSRESRRSDRLNIFCGSPRSFISAGRIFHSFINLPTRCQSTQIIMAHQLSQECLVENSHSSTTQGTTVAPPDSSPRWDESQLNHDLELSQLATVSSALVKDANKESANTESLNFPNGQPTALQFPEGATQSQGRDTDSSHSGATSSSQAEFQKYNSEQNASLSGDARHPMVEKMLVQPFVNVPYGKEPVLRRAMAIPGAAGQQVWLVRNEQMPTNGHPLEGQSTHGPHPNGVTYPMAARSQNAPGYYACLVPIPPEGQEADEQGRYPTHYQSEGLRGPNVYGIPHYLVPTNQQTRRRRPNSAEKPVPKHICQTCGRPFLRPSSLETHYRHHTGERPFPCPFPGCKRAEPNNGFSVQSNMKRHLNQIHKGWNPNERESSQLSDSDSSQNARASNSTEAVSPAGSVSPASQAMDEVSQA